MAARPNHFLAGKRIIVVGASFAGLSFVLALEHLWGPSIKLPTVTVYELDTRDKSVEKDPYVLNINGARQDDGLVAIEQLGLLTEVYKHGTLNGGDIRVWSDNWKWLSSINPTAYGNLLAATIRITRGNLKRILVGKAETTGITLNWGLACTSAERLLTGAIRVTLSDGTTQDCDFLVAADGANSNIRACFRPNDMKTEYAGATQIGGISHLPGGVPKPIDRDFGLQMSSGEGVCCIYNPFDGERVAWAVSTVGPERKAKTDFTAEEFQILKEEALDTAFMFQEPFKTVVQGTLPGTAFIRPAKEKHAFRHDANLTGVMFIGDANHILSPFEFVGANLALKDGWDLAGQICCNTSMNAAAASYDRISIPRFQSAFDFSHERIQFGHCTGKKWLFYKMSFGLLDRCVL
ncbi:monooxygenase, putative [Talaromyces stipitatus ATCC 10500]|uniref:Monooxygenase, putative n=1 Tax=Talaromyces stipitatus (strain ATCC 10500 / CBS 375.48 / QM 6759 / NRRL 1006) TaxID=441959 RepID=B8M0M1_TALSN|nr:monooxygenase, putative [Talaromyces stipitatus ATCC 10500]EED21404.1 monooxygenase, putative [Talaromyces stipitatus ATCC 10500]